MPLDIVPQSFASIFPLEVTQRIVNVTMTAMRLHHLGQRICNTVEFRTAQLSDFSAGQVHVVSGREHFVSFSWSAFRHDAKPIVTRNRLVVGFNSLGHRYRQNSMKTQRGRQNPQRESICAG